MEGDRVGVLLRAACEKRELPWRERRRVILSIKTNPHPSPHAPQHFPVVGYAAVSFVPHSGRIVPTDPGNREHDELCYFLW